MDEEFIEDFPKKEGEFIKREEATSNLIYDFTMDTRNIDETEKVVGVANYEGAKEEDDTDDDAYHDAYVDAEEGDTEDGEVEDYDAEDADVEKMQILEDDDAEFNDAKETDRPGDCTGQLYGQYAPDDEKYSNTEDDETEDDDDGEKVEDDKEYDDGEKVEDDQDDDDGERVEDDNDDDDGEKVEDDKDDDGGEKVEEVLDAEEDEDAEDDEDVTIASSDDENVTYPTWPSKRSSTVTKADEVRKILIATTQMSRFSDYVDTRLIGSGWKADMLNILRVEIGKNKDVSFQDLFNSIKGKAMELVSASLTQEFTDKIHEVYESEMPVFTSSAFYSEEEDSDVSLTS